MNPEHLAIVQDILLSGIPDSEVWVFGSRATGNANKTSDLDLAIISDGPVDLVLLGNLRDAFSESNLPFKVDVVDFADVSAEFKKLIKDEKLVMQKPKSTCL